MADPQTALRLVSARGPVATGLVAELARFYQQQTGDLLDVTAAAPGAVLATALQEGADLLLVEAAELEAAGPDAAAALAARVPFVANDFLLAGPADDPVRAGSLASILAVFRRIAAAGAPFLSPGAGSLARRKEREVWELAGLMPAPPWYRQVSAAAADDSAALLREALTGGCYTLCDRVSVVTAQEEVPVLFENDPVLRNDLVLAPLAPGRVPGARFERAAAFITWATAFEVQQAIGSYGQERYGTPLYLPLARYQWRPPQPASSGTAP